ncbi:hypothetical protein BH23ACT12_BH23ACT12_10230 [soil metagenome]
MSMTAGPISLIGGWEHTRGCEPIDQTLLGFIDCSNPVVAVVPAASSERMVPIAVERARVYWDRMGGSLRVALPGGDEAEVKDAIAAADIIVLTGGQSERIRLALHGSEIWDDIVQRWMNGAAVVGSSMGLMELFEFRFKLWPPRSLSLVPGLGLLKGHVAVPHFEKYGLRWWSKRVAERLGAMHLLGLDERTALVGRGDRFHVAGQGKVTVVGADSRVVYTAGSEVEIKLWRPGSDAASPMAP